MLKGCFTALVTPFTNDHKLDQRALEKLIEFQVTNGISGVLAVGTTGESPTLVWQEHNDVTRLVCEGTKGKCKAIAGTGSNSTRETLEGSEHAAKFGADAVLVVDPYYNGPSSLEIRREYVEPVAKRFPEIDVIPGALATSRENRVHTGVIGTGRPAAGLRCIGRCGRIRVIRP